MMKIRHFIISILLANFIELGMSELVLAKTAIEIDEDSSITSEVISSGKIKVSVNSYYVILLSPIIHTPFLSSLIYKS